MDLLMQGNTVEKLLRGMITQEVEKADANFVDDVRIQIKDTDAEKNVFRFFFKLEFLQIFMAN